MVRNFLAPCLRSNSAASMVLLDLTRLIWFCVCPQEADGAQLLARRRRGGVSRRPLCQPGQQFSLQLSWPLPSAVLCATQPNDNVALLVRWQCSCSLCEIRPCSPASPVKADLLSVAECLLFYECRCWAWVCTSPAAWTPACPARTLTSSRQRYVECLHDCPLGNVQLWLLRAFLLSLCSTGAGCACLLARAVAALVRIAFNHVQAEH